MQTLGACNATCSPNCTGEELCCQVDESSCSCMNETDTNRSDNETETGSHSDAQTFLFYATPYSMHQILFLIWLPNCIHFSWSIKIKISTLL